MMNFSEIVEQNAKILALSHPTTLKYFSANLHYSNQLNITKFGIGIA